MGMLSRDGCSVPLLPGANGMILGEGCGVVVLQRLTDALTRNSMIYALVQSTAVNHDGAAHNLLTPNPRAQHDVMCQALTEAARTPGGC